ncbi:hypothetical protein C900_03348 [Fulvivirga imtechensis AK7]|uniref:Uncharacterized protein n=1 Tax=Fulvivirga imtechensis AK7 TaxID=1237149 RepID=L8JRU1_9BACT|nr:hypothetical protein C900_03348 [Fulvivirga imtechensis AK7]
MVFNTREPLSSREEIQRWIDAKHLAPGALLYAYPPPPAEDSGDEAGRK